MKLLLSDERFAANQEGEKLQAISTWMASGRTREEQATREARFEDLLEFIDISSLPKSTIVDITFGKGNIVFPQSCREIFMEKSLMVAESKPSTSYNRPSTSKQAIAASKMSASLSRKVEKLYAYIETHSGRRALRSVNPSGQPGESARHDAPRISLRAVVPVGDSIYLFGGRTPPFDESVADVHKFDAVSGAFTDLRPLNRPRSSLSAVFAAGCIFVFGGFDWATRTFLSSCEKYSPNENKWTDIADMPTAREATAAIEIPNFGILVVGGWNGGSLRTAEVLNVKEETWTTIAPMNKPRCLPGIVYFQESVIVAGDLNYYNHTIERLPISSRLPLQWTLVNCEISVKSRIASLCIFGEDLLVAFGNGEIHKLRNQENKMASEPFCALTNIRLLHRLMTMK